MKKIDFKDKNTITLIVILAVILVPILFNQGKSLIIGAISAYQMSLPKEVQIATPEKRMINFKYETTGRVDAKDSIKIIARVEGWLEQKFFEEGDIVKKGQKLFQIQPEDYRLALQDAAARVNEAKAVYQNSVIEYKRAESLIKEDMVSREYYDNSIAMKNRNKALLDAAVAQYHRAKLNLSYTTITAPMDGRIGKLIISTGNYITTASGELTSIYKTTPIRVKFAVKSGTYIAMKKSQHVTSEKAGDLPVDIKLKLADGSIYNEIGKIEFMNNKIDEGTGTISFSALFDNPHEILVPGDYVNVIIEEKQKHEVMLIPQSATKTDVGTGYYVWVAKDGKAEKRNIVVSADIDNNWVVESGLNYDDQVIVKGIQDIYKSGQTIKAKPYVAEKDNDKKKGE